MLRHPYFADSLEISRHSRGSSCGHENGRTIELGDQAQGARRLPVRKEYPHESVRVSHALRRR